MKEQFITWFNTHCNINTNGKIFCDVIGSKGNYTTPDKLVNTYNSIVKALDERACVTLAEGVEYVEKLIASKAKTTIADAVTPNDFVREFIDTHRSSYKFNTNWTMISHEGDFGSHPITLDDLCQHAISYNENTTHYKLTADSIRRSFMVMKETQTLNSIDSICEHVMYNKSAEHTVNNVLEFCYDWWQIKEDKDIFFTLMKQWMWQVKRYLFNREVRYHIWLNFMGASGLGKTMWIAKFCKPFEDVYTQTSVDVLFDSSREIKKFTDNYILNFDELARKNNNVYTDTASASDMALIKSLLTASIFETRVMGGQTQMKAKRTFSVISSSNNHLYDTFYDASTMRRYFEFNCAAEHISDFDPLNKCMTLMTDAWKGIDENNDAGYFDPNSAVGMKITEIQSTYYPTNTTVFAWLKCEEADGKHDLTQLTRKEAYDLYRAWCEQERCHNKTFTNFVDAMTHYMPNFASGALEPNTSYKGIV